MEGNMPELQVQLLVLQEQIRQILMEINTVVLLEIQNVLQMQQVIWQH
jgi:hypothetical protein